MNRFAGYSHQDATLVCKAHDTHTLLKSVNEFFLYYPHFLARLGEIL